MYGGGYIYEDTNTNNQNDAMALHLYGLLMHQAGRSDAGAQMIERAIQLGLRTVESFNNLGECYKHIGRHSEAITAFRTAIQCNPNQVEPLYALGMLLYSLGQYAEASLLLENVVRLRPELPTAHYSYAAALTATGRAEQAIKQLEQTLDLDPNHRDAAKDLGVILQHLGRPDDAVKILTTLIDRHPDYLDGLIAYSNALLAAGRHDEAITLAKRLVDLAPSRHEPHHVLARAYRIAEVYDEAWNEAFKTLESNPDFLPAIGNIALIGEKTGSYSRAIEWLEKAVETHPNNAILWISISEAHSREGRIDESIKVLDRAMEHQPDHPDLRLARSARLFSAGRLGEGFQDYAARYGYRIFESLVKNAGKTMWDGSEPAGKHINVYAEQGFGDIIQFARYLPILVEKGATLSIVTGKPEICPLLRTIPGVTEVVVGEATLPNYDLHVALMSLPCIFKTTLDTIPNRIPYIHAEESKIRQWKPAIDAHAHGLKVGIVWGGQSASDPRRVCTVKDLSILFQIPNVSWYSLQTDEPREQLQDAPAGSNILDIGKDLKDFSDTAAVMSQLDLVVSIDTAAAHLAGAMGLRTWLMLPYYAEWRWFDKGDTSPWYPTMKLFRQKRIEDWTDVIQSIRQELLKLASDHKN